MLQWTWECRYFFDILFSFPLARYPKEGLLDPMVVVFLIWGISVLFPILGEPIYIPTNSLLGFPFLHILPNIRFFSRFLDVGILTDSDLHFWFWFSVTSDIEHLFMYLLAIWIFSLEKCLSSSSFHFKNSIACFCYWCYCYWGCMCSCIFWI